MKYFIKFFYILILFILFSCNSQNNNEFTESDKLDSEKVYNIFIVMDTIDDWSTGIKNGFEETMDEIMEEHNATVVYQTYDTKLDPAIANDILKLIESSQPDLICTINYPTVFADKMISSKLKDVKYKIVSENCIPVKSGIIKNRNQPDGNITGVSVFLQMNSQLRLIKKLDPNRKKLVFYSWDAVKILNSWFKSEITRACNEENIKLLEFKEVKHFEDTISLFNKYNNRKDVFFMCGVTAFVNKNGSPALANKAIEYFLKNINIPMISYDETTISKGHIGGASIIWYDIGVQLAEKAEKILKGANPGDLPWDYPRKYNIILNKKRADNLGIKIPQDLIDASYRIYTDYNGTFIGKNN